MSCHWLRAAAGASAFSSLAWIAACQLLLDDDSAARGGTDAAGEATAAPSPDGAGDAAGPGPAVDAARFCSAFGPNSPSSFCRDFDDDLPIKSGWNGGTEVSDNASLSIDDAGVPQRSGWAQVPQGNSTTCLRTALVDELIDAPGASINRLHLEFDLNVEQPNDKLIYLRVRFEPADAASTAWSMLDFAADQESGSLFEDWHPQDGVDDGYKGYPLLRWLLPGEWTKVMIDVTYGPPHVEVSYGGVPVLLPTNLEETPQTFAPNHAVISLGVIDNGCTGKPSVHFDNVRYLAE